MTNLSFLDRARIAAEYYSRTIGCDIAKGRIVFYENETAFWDAVRRMSDAELAQTTAEH